MAPTNTQSKCSELLHCRLTDEHISCKYVLQREKYQEQQHSADSPSDVMRLTEHLCSSDITLRVYRSGVQVKAGVLSEDYSTHTGMHLMKIFFLCAK